MRLPARHHVEIGILRGVSEPQTLIANGVVVRQDVAIRIPVVAVIRPLFRPVGVVVGVSRHHLAWASFALDVVLQGEKEKSGAVRWGRDACAWWIMRGYPQTVVIGAGHRVVRIELEVGAEVNRWVSGSAWPAGNGRRFWITKAERCRTTGPSRVIESGSCPVSRRGGRLR